MPFPNLQIYPPREFPSLYSQGTEASQSAQSSVSTVQARPFALNPPSRVGTPTIDTTLQTNIPGFEREYTSTPMPHSTSTGSKPQITVTLDQPYLILNGIGPDVDSTRMSGKVILSLPEDTSLREVTLQFRGKARIPMPASESLINNTASITYVICNHEWHFLDAPTSSTSTTAPTTGKKQHHPVRTLKAGQHTFPFHLDIGGSLPASLTTPVLGGASVTYKLRAIAHRPALSLSPNPSYTVPVSIVRRFSSDALEYQQTLEIENTWPGKVMYSVVLPHKAWAGGDELIARLTLSPLTKGVKVLGVVTGLWETTRVWARSGWVEDSKVIVWGRSEIRNGKAVSVPITGFGTWQGLGIGHVRASWEGEAAAASMSFIASHTREEDERNATEDESRHGGEENGHSGYYNSDVVTLVKMKIPPTTFGQHGKQPTSRPATPGTATPPYSPHATSGSHSHSHSHQTTPVELPPPHLTPSSSVDPIHTSHRVRWSIFLLNPDGHVSELRCSLPIHILDGRLLEEAKGFSLPVRRVLFSRPQNFNSNGEPSGSGAQMEVDDEFEEEEALDSQFLEADRQLPSYHAHLRDRVANMFLPEGSTMRVNNPWLSNTTSMPMSPDADQGVGSSWHSPLILPTAFGVSGADSLTNSPRLRPLDLSSSDIPYSHTPPRIDSPSQLNSRNPSHPQSIGVAASSSFGSSIDRHVITGPTPLEYINSELLLSLNRTAGHSGSQPQSRPQSRQGSRPGSRWGSRPHSRNGSPERDAATGRGEPCSPAHEHGHGHSHHGLRHFIKATMRPFTALTHSHSHSHASSSRHSPTESASPVSHAPASSHNHNHHHNHNQNQNHNHNYGFGNSHSHNHPHTPHHHQPAHPPFHHSYTSNNTPSPLAHSRSGSHVSLAHVASAPSMATGSTRTPDYMNRALAEVPDYSVAARGFMGGVPPLSSLQGLPSYEEASRHRRSTLRQNSTTLMEEDADSDDSASALEMRVGRSRSDAHQNPVSA